MFSELVRRYFEGGAAQYQSAWAEDENGPMNVYMGRARGDIRHWRLLYHPRRVRLVESRDMRGF